MSGRAATPKGLLKALPRIYEADDLMRFPRAALRLLGAAAPSLLSTYNEMNVCTKAVRVLYEPRGLRRRFEAAKPGFWRLKDEHPLMARLERGLIRGAEKITDHLSRSAFRRTAVYREVLGPLGVEDTMVVVLRSEPPFHVYFALNGKRTFTAVEKANVQLLCPHLELAFAKAVQGTSRVAGVLTGPRISQPGRARGVILAAADGRIIHADGPASELLTAHFGGEEELPGAWRAWLDARVEGSLEVRCGGTVIVAEKHRQEDKQWLIVLRACGEEWAMGELGGRFDVSRREAEALYWLTCGKTNGQMADILGISERTVAKHLENLFPKLGVERRQEAMLRALEVLGD